MEPEKRINFIRYLFYMMLFVMSHGVTFADVGNDYVRYHDQIEAPDAYVRIKAAVRLDLQLPSSIAVSPDRTSVYIADAYAPPAVSVVNIATMQQTDVIRPGGKGAISAIATSGNGTSIYAALSSGTTGKIIEISSAGHNIKRSLALDAAPRDLALDNSGNTLVVLTNKTIYRIALDDFRIIETLSSGRGPVKIRLSRNGKRFFVTNAGSRTLTVLTPDANSTKLIDIPVNSVPWDVFDVHRSDGKAVFNRIFAALFHSDHLAVFNMSDMQQTGVVFTGSAPTMLESSHSGEMLFVLRTCFSAMVSVDPENLHIIKAFNLPVPSPRDMAITKDDLYLLVSSDNGNLYFIPSAQFFNKKAKPVETHFRVLFDLDKAVIKPEFYKLLDQLAGRLKKTGEKVELDGYTCDLGTEPHNKKLSLKRSESVREYLKNKGVPPANITLKGFGDASPYAPNKDEKHRRLNRRVEIEIKK